MDVPVPETVRVYIGDNNKQEELQEFVLLSKALNRDCQHSCIEWDLVPLFILSPLHNRQHGGSPGKFLQTMYQYQLDEDTNRKLQSHRRMIVNDIDKFGIYPHKETRIFTENI